MGHDPFTTQLLVKSKIWFAYGKYVSLGPANGLAFQLLISDHVLCLVSVDAIATRAPFAKSERACNSRPVRNAMLETSITVCSAR